MLKCDAANEHGPGMVSSSACSIQYIKLPPTAYNFFDIVWNPLWLAVTSLRYQNWQKNSIESQPESFFFSDRSSKLDEQYEIVLAKNVNDCTTITWISIVMNLQHIKVWILGSRKKVDSLR